jgi:[ribosomal protein S5]-alanine N-acetyltransferase
VFLATDGLPTCAAGCPRAGGRMRFTGTIITDRLVLRQFSEDDAQAMFDNWASDPQVTRFLTWEPHADVSETRRIIRGWIRQYSMGSMDWCITMKGDGMPIGSITAVQEHPSEGWCELGLCLMAEKWGRGYMTEACRAVIEYIFENTRYMNIQARYDLENEASGKMLERSGMYPVGVLRKRDKYGEERTYQMMAVSRPEYYR